MTFSVLICFEENDYECILRCFRNLGITTHIYKIEKKNNFKLDLDDLEWAHLAITDIII